MSLPRNSAESQPRKACSNTWRRNGVVGISDVDTRMLVRYIRSKGAMNAIISSNLPQNSSRRRYARCLLWMDLNSPRSLQQRSVLVGDPDAPIKVAVLDLGIKKSIATNLAARGCYCKVFPAKTSFEEMAAWKPHGYFISNGPGDPSVMGMLLKR